MPNDLLTQAHSPGRTPGRPKLSTRALAHTPTPVTNYHSGRRAGRQLGEGVKGARTKATLTACLRRRDPGKYPSLLAPGREEARRGNTEGEEPARPQVPSATRASPGQGHCMLSQRPSGDVGTEGPLGLMAVVWGEHTRHTRGREQCRWFTRRGGAGGRPRQVGSSPGTGLALSSASGMATYTGASLATRNPTGQETFHALTHTQQHKRGQWILRTRFALRDERTDQ